MKVVYIAGPFRGESVWKVEQNVRIAEERALELWQHGVPVICPHTNTRFFQGAAPDIVWLKGYLEILKRCDALLTVERFAHSKGTLAEIDKARRCHINVFYDVGRCLDFCLERGLYKPKEGDPT